jgi:hypothetical protein
MIAWRVVSLAGLTLALVAAPVSQAEAQQSSSRRSMVFFLAQGGPDACGPGCTDWIAADGAFGPDTLGRLTAFLHSLDRPNLPIFFHSSGGSLQAAVAVGYKLRGWRIAAGVGRTVVQGCKETDPRDPHCRELIETGEPVSGDLRYDRAICASACVAALIGAPVRHVSEKARLGIHAPNYRRNRQWGVDTRAVEEATRARTMDSMRRFVVRMGVDGSLIDEMDKTPHNKVHWLSREEMKRFGILTGDGHETGWSLIERPAVMIVKSLTRTTVPLTTGFEIGCHRGDRVRIRLRRELPDEELGAVSEVRLVSGGEVLSQSRDLNDRRDDERRLIVPVAALRRVASNGLVINEAVITGTGSLTRSAPIAAAGLAEALDRMLQGCGAARGPRPAPTKLRRLRIAGEAATLPPLWLAPYNASDSAAGTLLQ